MKINIKLNGIDIYELGLRELDGTLNALNTPAPLKPLVKNENSAMNGVSYVSAQNRKINERKVNLPFLLQCDSLQEQQDRLNELRDFLVRGNGNGVNEVQVAETGLVYYFIFEDFKSFSNFGMDGYCRVNLQFIEPNPKSRNKIN